MSDTSDGGFDLREGLLEIDRRLRSIQEKLGPGRETTPPLEVAPAPVPDEPQPRRRIGPLAEVLERSRWQPPPVIGRDRQELAAELKELAELQRLLANTTQGLGTLLEQYRKALEQALGHIEG
jgi:hypothetical protein